LHEGWQDHWPHEVVQDFRLAAYPFSSSGAIALAADGWLAAKRFIRRLRR
jgi:hypothetical protein